jgi:hypothetical protein
MVGGGTVRFVYRFGTATDDALTPRQKDLLQLAGSKPGLSVELSLPEPGSKAQKIDVTLLVVAGLRFVPDNLAAGGRGGHGVIAPVNEAGVVDEALLQEWAACRGTGTRHRFTQAILNAIVERDIRSNS